MSESFNIEIISPEKKLLTDKVNSATIPSFDGEMTILSNHISLSLLENLQLIILLNS